MQHNVILVDNNDQQIGIMEKLQAHKKGLLHRAFSIFILNSQNQLLLQQRASNKYHSQNLWTNTCCSHPQPNESILSAASRRLLEEMALTTPLTFLHKFIYYAPLDNNLIEHEFDYIFVGKTDQKPTLNPNEAQNYQYASLSLIQTLILQNPHHFTPWFKICIQQYSSLIFNH